MTRSLAKQELNDASALGLHDMAVQDFLPPARLTVSEYAEQNRFLPNDGGGRGPRWRNAVVPYTIEPSDCLDDPQYLTVCVVGPGQVAKTVIAENYALKSVSVDPANMLWYMQSDDGVEAYVKARINPMIDDHDAMQRAQGLRPVDDSLHFKQFRNMRIEFLSATMGNLINKNAPRIVADEVDAYTGLLGDVKVLLDIRRQSFGLDSKLLAISHPDRARGMKPETDWGDGIMSIYRDSDRRNWWWPCPQCGKWSSPNPTATSYMHIDYPEDGTLDEIEKQAVLLCPHNGCCITDDQRRWMNARGIWIGEGQELSADGKLSGALVKRVTAGFWIVGAMSPFVLGGIGALARAKVRAERDQDVSGEDQSLRQVMVKQFGVPYEPKRAEGTISANDLAARAETDLKLGLVPEGVRFLTTVVDVQLSTFEWLTRGWGVMGESWVVDRGRILAEPATNADDWDALLELFQRRFALADKSGRTMVARACGIDSSGSPGVTNQAYAAWLRWRKAKRLRLYGKVGGREAWSVLLTKGATGLNAAKLQIIYPDTSRKAAATARGEVPVGLFNPNLFKDDLAGQFMRAEPGPTYIHFPIALCSKEPPHIWFEQAVAEQPDHTGRWKKIKATARNEALDQLVMSHVIAHLHGLPRIDWTRPPAWAAPWESNSLIAASPAQGGAPEDQNPRARDDGAVKITIDGKPKKSIASRLA